jgi:hypothetical protein
MEVSFLRLARQAKRPGALGRLAPNTNGKYDLRFRSLPFQLDSAVLYFRSVVYCWGRNHDVIVPSFWTNATVSRTAIDIHIQSVD